MKRAALSPGAASRNEPFHHEEVHLSAQVLRVAGELFVEERIEPRARVVESFQQIARARSSVSSTGLASCSSQCAVAFVNWCDTSGVTSNSRNRNSASHVSLSPSKSRS